MYHVQSIEEGKQKKNTFYLSHLGSYLDILQHEGSWILMHRESYRYHIQAIEWSKQCKIMFRS